VTKFAVACVRIGLWHVTTRDSDSRTDQFAASQFAVCKLAKHALRAIM